jgi:hypothetical protein
VGHVLVWKRGVRRSLCGAVWSVAISRVTAVEARHDESRCGQSGRSRLGTAVESRSGLAGWVPTRSVMAVN